MTLKRRRQLRVEWNGDTDPDTFEPIRTLKCPCYHCGAETQVVVDTVIDLEVDMWRERYERLHASLNDVLKQCTERHGTNPMEEMWKDFRAMLEDLRGRKPWESTGEEWKP